MSEIYTLAHKITTKQINALIVLLEKIKSQLPHKNHSESDLLAAKLAPDMFPLVKQIQLVADHAKMAFRLAGMEPPVMEDNETTLDQLIARLKKTVELIQDIPEDSYAHAEDRQIILPIFAKMAPGKALEAQEYFVNFAIPNFYFHLVTAYCILRNQGYEIGKMDFIGGLNMVDAK